MDKWAGYQVKFDDFKRYYKAESPTDNSKYLAKFVTAFRLEMKQAGFPEGLYSDTVNSVSRNMSRLCSGAKTQMVSKGVPSASATQLIRIFQKWFKSYWK